MTYNTDLAQSNGPRLYQRAKQLIPGGTQLLSKRPEMFAPDLWPSYYEKAKGCTVWDLDGRAYTDMSIMGVGAAILGYADDEVDDAVVQAIRKGVTTTLNCPEEVQLAEVLVELHPWAGMVRYARSGGEAMSMAIRIARASTKRDVVAASDSALRRLVDIETAVPKTARYAPEAGWLTTGSPLFGKDVLGEIGIN